VEIDPVRAGGGAFEVFLDGRQVFSKLREGRFPAYQEIPMLLR
jgi:selT/selW/selH-like putative selenoprotein